MVRLKKCERRRRERERRERKKGRRDMEGDGRKEAWLASEQRESLVGGSGLEQGGGDDDSHFEHI